MNEKITDTKTRLQQIMNLRGLKQVDIQRKCEPYCEKFGVKMNKSDLSQYVSGKVEPSQYKLMILGMALNVSEAWLMGFDVPMERQINNISSPLKDLSSLSVHKVPLIDEIACGAPIIANEEFETFISIDLETKADYCLKCKGDSMINARIYDGDIVFIKKQDVVDNGEIAAVIISDEVTLKRVYYYPEENTLRLQPENPTYRPLVYTGADLKQVRILGKAVAFQSTIR